MPVYRACEVVLGSYWRRAWRDRFLHEASQRHRTTPYDALLTLGVAPAFVLSGTPTVAWLQGPLQTELEAIRRQRDVIRRTSGHAVYGALSSYYRVRVLRDRHALDKCDEVICGSEWSKHALAAWGYPIAHLHALPYPIDLERFRPTVAAENASAPLLVSVGRLDPRKRLDLLVGAFEIVGRHHPDARLLVVGQPRYARSQLRLLALSPVSDRIDYRPAVPQVDVARLIARADVLVQPSENENFGSAVAEALACGVPVVVGPTNGTADYIDSGSAVFASYTPEAVAATINLVLDRRRRDPAHAAKSARAAAERSFSLGTVVDGLESVLQKAIGTDGSRSE